ncbi:hypothetical protein BDV96DRAFT_206571 [Lophiotrema nucula]|uniref:NmrA-like domain-containing protein n=1 Tax=Lophiotrema nucula TaxID=690887 RepID=A0A6A5ZNH8_9PLEO|nr:hypothetical protein BDV96DRAFT_206571 [Lophiotrema nucula]
MSKIIAVTGGTGAQGGGVANIMLKTPGWKVRVITRNADGEKAKALVAQGAEVVQADFNDEDSLVKAFEGVHAIFAVTNFWEALFTGNTQQQAGEIEEEQSMKLARAATKTSTLEHYIWSTLPGAKNMTDGKIEVPHLDYKANVDARIKSELPQLANKTTYLFFGYYPSNMAFFPFLKPIEVPGTGKWIQILPTPSTATIPITGDMTITPGTWVRQILANGSKTFGKYAIVASEILTFGELLEIWSQVSGREGAYLETTLDDFAKVWGVAGAEMGAQLKFGEVITDWGTNYPGLISKEDLGITEDDAPGAKKALEALKSFL